MDRFSDARHLIGFGVLTLFFSWALGPLERKGLWWATGLLMLGALLLELAQIFTVHRHATVADLLYGWAGIASVTAAIMLHQWAAKLKAEGEG